MLTIAATALLVAVFAIAAVILVNEWSQWVERIPV